MSIFDILGPVMVGPSSSHTAGAAKIGYVARELLGEPVAKADLYLHGSFLATGKGHGTDRALVGGLLGMKPDDERLPHSFELAKEKGLEFAFFPIELRDAHPNSVQLKLTGQSEKKLTITASSIGGGRIRINTIDGLGANFGGDYPTLIVRNGDTPGCVSMVASMLTKLDINIGTMQLYRSNRGGNAVMVIECDNEIPEEALYWLEQQPQIIKVSYLSKKEGLDEI